MSFRLFGCVCGQFHSPGAGLGMPDARVAVPIPFYVIEHPEGVVLFDCGAPAAMLDRDDVYLKRMQDLDLDVTLTAEETVTAHLERLDIDPARVSRVVLSHLHFDHAGGLKELPNATLVVQRREWEAGFEPELSNRYFLRKRYFDLGHRVEVVDGEHDVFGDGALTCIPSFGHTPGHQSLRVRNGSGDYILVGDACYHAGVVESRLFPESADHPTMNRSLDALLALRDPGTIMVFGHDPDQWGDSPVLPADRG